MDYILLAGIHGVGKSTLLNQLNKVCPIEAYTICSLIKQAGVEMNDSDKQTKQISRNQNLWKKELKKIKYSYRKIILDGHFTLLNRQGNIVPLPINTFDDINISRIILKQEKPKIIQSRLLKRDNCNWDIDKIKMFQDIEEKTAEKYSLDTGTPLFVYNDSKLFNDLVNFINER